MLVFAVSGYSGTGKTTLVESIVRELGFQGYTVITLKSSQHEPKEGKGTDTERLRLAGAKTSYFRGPSDKERFLRDIVSSSRSDYLIVEGMKSSPIPKFWCIGDSQVGDTIPIAVKAIISWNASCVEDKYGIPILESENIGQIISIIRREAINLDQLDI